MPQLAKVGQSEADDVSNTCVNAPQLFYPISKRLPMQLTRDHQPRTEAPLLFFWQPFFNLTLRIFLVLGNLLNLHNSFSWPKPNISRGITKLRSHRFSTAMTKFLPPNAIHLRHPSLQFYRTARQVLLCRPSFLLFIRRLALPWTG